MLAENGIAPTPGTTNGYVVGGNHVDGSWELSVFVEDLDQEVKVRVLGELTVGGLMHRIVEGIHLQQSWSDHGIWWASRNMWLLRNRTTLDQCGIQSDAKLMFRRIHGMVQIILPSLVPVTLRLSFAASTYHVVVDICKQLNIRHPEELSLTFPITREHLKANTCLPVLRHGVRRTVPAAGSVGVSDTSTLNKKQLRSLATFAESDRTPNSPYETLRSGAPPGTLMRLRSNQSLDDDLVDGGGRHRTECVISSRSAKIVFDEDWLLRPKGMIQKARLNSVWLDSSRSLLEHGIQPLSLTDTNGQPPILYLRFKYHTFYDLNPKYDPVRIHQLFEHARWSLLSGVLDCTEDEMIVFAAYQLQAQLQPDEPNWGNTLFNPFTTPYFPTLGPSSTLGGVRKISGSRLSPDLSRRQYLTLGSRGQGGFGREAQLSPMPGTVSPASGTSIIDGTLPWSAGDGAADVDEVDELLAGLEKSCGVAEEPGSAARSLRPHSPLHPGNGCSPGLNTAFDSLDTAEIPSLQDSLRVYRDSNRFLRRPKVYWVVIRETSLYLFRSERELDSPLYAYSLRDSTVTPAMNASSHKYIVRLNLSLESAYDKRSAKSNGAFAVPSRPSSREELVLRFEAAEQYARWLAACRLVSRGKTLASRVAYEHEMAAIWDTLRLQLPGAQASDDTTDSANKCLGDLTDFCTERIIRKARSKQHLRQRIVEAHANLRDLTALESKCKYIQAWQQLTGFGRSYFIVAYERPSKDNKLSDNGKRALNVPPDHLVAISPSGVELVSPQTGDIYRSWTFTELKSWDVNWEASTVSLDFRSDHVQFRPLCANCKTVMELLGGYVCLGMRTPEGNQEFNERLFLRLTGAHE